MSWTELSWSEILLGRVVLSELSLGRVVLHPWNDLPESLISSSERSDDSVSKFTSLVRARD